MKAKYNFKITIFLLAILFYTGCKNKKNNDPSETATGNLAFHFHTLVEYTEVADYNTIYTLTNGRQISVSIAQLYISGIQLVKMDGTLYDVPNSNELKVQELEPMSLGAVPAGNYKSVRFNVGLNSTTNHQTPKNSNLTLYRPDMWFGATVQPDGFIFMNFQGMIDTSVAANNLPAQMQNFCYKIGTDANIIKVSMPVENYTVLPNKTAYIHMYIDYNKLLTGVQLNNSTNLTVATAADNSSAIATMIKNNIPSMFTYE